ncbi:MAG TPA: nitroreductase family protein [Jatrophihabitans sp.]|nr:nitroreductase family protein [Jatrophihabitans sp.]
MELATVVRARRSAAPITDEAPSDAELADCLRLAAHSPDHAGLRAWRLVTLRGDDRLRLGEALVAGYGDVPGTPAAAKTAGKALRAPLLVSIIATPVEHPKVPRWEQIAAIGALTATLQLVLYDAGYTAMWRTGPGVELAPVRELLGLAEHEQLLGWLYVGGTVGDPQPSPEPDVTGKLSSLPGSVARAPVR